MMVNRLIDRIEEQWELIAQEVVAQARKDGDAGYYRTLSEAHIRERAADLVRNLSRWLESENDEELRLRYELLGAQRCREDVPLQDVLYKIFLIKRKIRTFAMFNNDQTSHLALHQELELLRRMGHCFDLVACHVAKGYSDQLALRQSERKEVSVPA